MKSYKLKFLALFSALAVFIAAGCAWVVSTDIVSNPVVAAVVFAAMGVAAAVIGVVLFLAPLDAAYDVTVDVLDENFNTASKLPENTEIDGNIRSLVMKMKADKVYMDTVLNRNPVTEIRNEVALESYLGDLKKKLENTHSAEYAVACFEVENLATIKKTYGSKIADDYLRNACRLVCEAFSHSPVFHEKEERLIVIITGGDYIDKDRIMEDFRQKMMDSWSSKAPQRSYVIAGGMSACNFSSGKGFNEASSQAYNILMANRREVIGSYAAVRK